MELHKKCSDENVREHHCIVITASQLLEQGLLWPIFSQISLCWKLRLGNKKKDKKQVLVINRFLNLTITLILGKKVIMLVSPLSLKGLCSNSVIS